MNPKEHVLAVLLRDEDPSVSLAQFADQVATRNAFCLANLIDLLARKGLLSNHEIEEITRT